jgi:hypothetical protein
MGQRIASDRHVRNPIQVLLTLVLVVVSSGDAFSACELQRATQSLPEGIALWRNAPNTVALYATQVRRDDDGAPNAYHPCGANFADGVCTAGAFGLDHICSGVTVRDANNQRVPPSDLVRGTNKTTSARCLQTYRDARNAGWPLCGRGKACVQGWPGIVLVDRKPQVQGLAKDIPALRPEGHAFAGYYISQTALSHPDTGAPDGQSSYIDARRVPYIVVPGASVLTGDDWRFGSRSRADLAMVIEAQPQGPARAVFAVIADTGPADETGEGSLALLGRLQNHSVSDLDAARPEAAALPNKTFPELATYVLFKNSGEFLKGVWPERDLSAADIAAAGRRALGSIGGISAVAGCGGIPAESGGLVFVTE